MVSSLAIDVGLIVLEIKWENKRFDELEVGRVTEGEQGGSVITQAAACNLWSWRSRFRA